MADPNIAMSRTESPATQSFHTVCIVKDYVRERRLRSREMFVPLHHPAGHAQADFGEAMAVIGGVARKVHILAFDLPHSDACFVKAYPAETTEAFCDGHNAAVAFFGGVPRSILYDNTKLAVARILGDGKRQRTRVFTELQSHYLFEDRFGRPGKGNDKGKVEGLVGFIRRNFLVPVPRVESIEAPNDDLAGQCRRRQAARLRGHKETIGERLARDRQALLPLPPAPYDACDKRRERIGVDASTMEANAALRNIVRRDTGEGYREMLEHLARESGIETPTAEDLARLDRKRKGKKLSNQDWVSRSDPEAKIAKMKDGTTHLAYKPEHAVDLDTGAVVAAELHPADEGDTTTLPKTLETAKENLASVDAAPTAEDPAECVTDKGYHSRAVLKALDNGPWKTRIAEPKQKGFARWRGDEAARRAVTNNRTRLLSGVAKEAFKLRAEIVERSFAHNLDRGGMRRTWLRGRENVHKRYLLHVAGHNLSLLMRQLIGAGTPREAVAGGYGGIFVLLTPTGAMLVALGVSQSGQTVFAAAFLIWE